MARGKMSLAETVDEKDIVDLGEEINIPNILIDSNFGISGGYGDYALVQKKVAYRTGKEEDGINNGKVIKYLKWEDVNYAGNIVGIFNNYLNYVSLNKIKKLKKCDDFKVVADIYNEIQKTLTSCIKNICVSKDVKSSGLLIDELSSLKDDIAYIKSVRKEAEILEKMIKEKRKIIVK